MESGFYLNEGTPPPPPFHLKPNIFSSIPTSPTLPSPTEIQENNYYFLPNWEKSTNNTLKFDSVLGASNSNISNENFMIRELIGKLENIGNNSTNTSSCYITPLNSPPKVNLHHVIEQLLHNESLNFSGLGNHGGVAEFDADPGFVERAARFSCLGSKSFNGRINQVGLYNPELAYNNGGSPLRVSSSPSHEAIGFHKASNELMNSRKRKAASRGKDKEMPPNIMKDAETSDYSDTKRSKSIESNIGNGNGNSFAHVKAEESKGSGDDASKPPEPPKDYIHVRARRGQATDSHSLAERVRREKISERMKLLRDLVPGCNKVTGKALMLDEIINYVQSLQRQVEFLSMKLASLNTRLDFNKETITSMNIFQTNHQLPHPPFQLDSSASDIFGHQPLKKQVLHSNISNGSVPLDPLNTGVFPNPSLQPPQLDAFNPNAPLCSTLCEDELQAIVQMGIGQSPR